MHRMAANSGSSSFFYFSLSRCSEIDILDDSIDRMRMNSEFSFSRTNLFCIDVIYNQILFIQSDDGREKKKKKTS